MSILSSILHEFPLIDKIAIPGGVSAILISSITANEFVSLLVGIAMLVLMTARAVAAILDLKDRDKDDKKKK